jgi:hypothetical protein
MDWWGLYICTALRVEISSGCSGDGVTDDYNVQHSILHKKIG